MEFAKDLLDPRQGRGVAGHRLRRIWRRLCARGAGRERAPHPPGGAQCEEVSLQWAPINRPPSWPRRRSLAPEMTAPLRIAIAGLGTVGGGVVKALAAQASQTCRTRAGRAILPWSPPCRARDSEQGARLRDHRLARRSAGAGRKRRRCRGGTDRRRGRRRPRRWSNARSINGKHVVTANKALLAKHGQALAELAEEGASSAQIRSRGGRRHPHRQGPARRA